MSLEKYGLTNCHYHIKSYISGRVRFGFAALALSRTDVDSSITNNKDTMTPFIFNIILNSDKFFGERLLKVALAALL